MQMAPGHGVCIDDVAGANTLTRSLQRVFLLVNVGVRR